MWLIQSQGPVYEVQKKCTVSDGLYRKGIKETPFKDKYEGLNRIYKGEDPSKETRELINCWSEKTRWWHRRERERAGTRERETWII